MRRTKWIRSSFVFGLLIISVLPTLITSAQVRLGGELASVEGAWVPMGPSPIENCSGLAGGMCSGRVTAIALDPSRPGTIYVGAAQGGVWKSTNDGSSWIPLTDGAPSLAVGTIAVDANGYIYVGTGEGDNSGDSYYGAGILKSTDGGNTWIQLGASTFGRSAFTRIITNPKNPNIVIATTNSGATSSTHVAIRVDPGVPLGVYVSTNGGNSWTRTLTAQRSYASDVVFDPVDPSTVYAAVDGGVYISSDAGTTWRGPLAGGLPATDKAGRISLAISASSPMTVYAAIEVTSAEGSGGTLYRTTNGGNSWSQVPTPKGPLFIRLTGEGSSFCTPQCSYDMFVAVDPSDSNILYLGGLDLYRSTNGGTTWTDLGGYGGLLDLLELLLLRRLAHIHPDQHAFAFDPFSHTTIYVGNDGGIWSAKNADTCLAIRCWVNLNAGLMITQFTSLAAHPTDGRIFFGGTQDNGTPMHGGTSPVWKQLDGGDGGWTAFDRKNPRTMYHTFFGLNIERSDNGGSTWRSITSGLNPRDKSLFYVPMAMDPNSPTTLYLGTYRLYKTENRGDTWIQPSPGLSFPASGNCRAGDDCIAAIAVAASDGRYVYAGTNTGKFFVSRDEAESFSEIDIGLPRAPVSKIFVDSTNPEIVFVTFSGFGTGHVFFTSIAGRAWSDISSNLSDVPANAIAVDPSGATIYVGTDKGVYVSTDHGRGWSLLGTGFPRVSVVDLVFAADGTLLAATHGRGVWAFSTRLATLTAQPPIAALTIDGILYGGDQLPRIFELGSSHSVQVSPTVPGIRGVRYVFTQWSDGSRETSRTIRFTKPVSLTAIFKTQYELKVISDYGDPQGSGWYDAGSDAAFSVASPQPEPGFLGLIGGKIVLLHWTGDSTDTSSTASIRMDAPKTVRAEWATDNTLPYLVLGILAIIAVAALAVTMKARTKRTMKPQVVGAGISQKQVRFCLNCGNQLPRADATYCARCGAKQN